MEAIILEESGICGDCGEYSPWLIDIGRFRPVCPDCLAWYDRCEKCGEWKWFGWVTRMEDGRFLCGSCEEKEEDPLPFWYEPYEDELPDEEELPGEQTDEADTPEEAPRANKARKNVLAALCEELDAYESSLSPCLVITPDMSDEELERETEKLQAEMDRRQTGSGEKAGAAFDPEADEEELPPVTQSLLTSLTLFGVSKNTILTCLLAPEAKQEKIRERIRELLDAGIRVCEQDVLGILASCDLP